MEETPIFSINLLISKVNSTLVLTDMQFTAARILPIPKAHQTDVLRAFFSNRAGKCKLMFTVQIHPSPVLRTCADALISSERASLVVDQAPISLARHFFFFSLLLGANYENAMARVCAFNIYISAIQDAFTVKTVGQRRNPNDAAVRIGRRIVS